MTSVLIFLVLICGFYVAWNIGANDVANAMGTSVGSGALTLRNAVILAAIFEFAGAAIVGSNVSETVRKKMFDPADITAMTATTAIRRQVQAVTLTTAAQVAIAITPRRDLEAVARNM